MANPRTKKAFALLAGVSRPAVTQNCKAGKTLAAAVLPNGNIDADHPAALAFLSARGKKGTKLTNVEQQASAVTEDITDDYMDLTLRQIIDKHGSTANFAEFLKLYKDLVAIQEKELKNKKTKGELIPLEMVQNHIFDFLDGLTTKMLMDAPKSIGSDVVALIKSGATLEDITPNIQDTLGSYIQGAKARIEKVLDEQTK